MCEIMLICSLVILSFTIYFYHNNVLKVKKMHWKEIDKIMSGICSASAWIELQIFAREFSQIFN